MKRSSFSEWLNKYHNIMYCIKRKDTLAIIYTSPSYSACIAILEDKLWGDGNYDNYFVDYETI